MSLRFSAVSLLAALCLSGCGPGASPPPSASPARAATPAPVQESPAAGDSNGSPSSGSQGSDGGPGGAGGSASKGPSGSTGSERHLSRAELDARFEKDTATLSPEASLNKNPAELRSEARPKTIKSMKGRNGYDIVMDKHQPEATENSRKSGRKIYTANCAACHGSEGNPVATGTLPRYAMADLTDPMQYKYGADARGIFRSIAFGTAAPPHGTYNGILSDQQIWDVVAYLESIQKGP